MMVWENSGRKNLLPGMPGQVQQGVDLRDRHALRAGRKLDDLLPGLDRTLVSTGK